MPRALRPTAAAARLAVALLVAAGSAVSSSSGAAGAMDAEDSRKDAGARASVLTRGAAGAFQSGEGPGPASRPASASGVRAPSVAIDDPELRARMRLAVDRGLRYLARRQSDADGGVLMTGDDPPIERRAPYATTALAALAFLADGNAETRGPHSASLRRAIDYLASKATFDPDGIGAYLGADGDSLSRMHGHGYATLALAEVLGMGGAAHGAKRHERLKTILTAAIRKIEMTQGDTGGWYYAPRKEIDHEGSITITLVQALRAARNAGVAVQADTIRRAVEYVRQSQVKETSVADFGSFRYRIGSRETSVALTAAAVSTLNATGDYDSEAIDRGMRYILKELATREREGFSWRLQRFPAYEHLYIAQALLQYRDADLFAQWYRREVPRILARQRVRVLESNVEEGFWDDDPFGSVLCTAIECIVLRMDDSVLPILQR